MLLCTIYNYWLQYRTIGILYTDRSLWLTFKNIVWTWKKELSFLSHYCFYVFIIAITQSRICGVFLFVLGWLVGWLFFRFVLMFLHDPLKLILQRLKEQEFPIQWGPSFFQSSFSITRVIIKKIDIMNFKKLTTTTKT